MSGLQALFGGPGRTALATILAGLVCAGSAGAQDVDFYECSFPVTPNSRGYLPAELGVAVPAGGWTVLVVDDIILSTGNDPIEARVTDKAQGRISFIWSVLASPVPGPKKHADFKLTLLTGTNDASIRASWGSGFKAVHETAAGRCRHSTE